MVCEQFCECKANKELKDHKMCVCACALRIHRFSSLLLRWINRVFDRIFNLFIYLVLFRSVSLPIRIFIYLFEVIKIRSNVFFSEWYMYMMTWKEMKDIYKAAAIVDIVFFFFFFFGYNVRYISGNNKHKKTQITVYLIQLDSLF